jgi:polar amino acid transport system substrate-binding protein
MHSFILKACLAAAALVSLVLGPADARTLAEIIKSGKIVIAIDPSNPPFSSVGTSGAPEGFEPDLTALLGGALGVAVELVPTTVQNRIAYLVAGQVDLIMIGITAARAKSIWYSIPYATDGAVLVGRKDLKVSTLDDLPGKRVGIARGAMQDIVLTKDAPKGVEIMRFDDQATAVQALISGQVDLSGSSMLAYQVLNRNNPGKDFETKLVLRSLRFGFGMQPDSSDLLQWVNTFLMTVKDSGELEAISEKWRKLPLGPLPTF